MKICNGLIIIVIMFSHVLVARLTVLDHTPVKVEMVSTYEMRFCYISFIKIDGVMYLIKQKKSQFLRKILSVVRDAVTAHIAENFGIAHQVDIIPAGIEFPGKPRKDWPATIHTIAPGKMIKDKGQNRHYKHIKLQQKEEGFTYQMLQWMNMYPQLIMIMALDIFVCNHDRHKGNLFYDPKTDSFCAIDMDSAFRYNLSSIACKNFMAMINDRRFKFSVKDIQTLGKLNNCLKFLIEKYPSVETLKIYDDFAQKAGFIPGSDLYTEKVRTELVSNRKIILQSYKDIQQLVQIIDQLVKKVKTAYNIHHFPIKK